MAASRKLAELKHRQRNVFPRREFPKKVVKLEDEPDLRVSHLGEFDFAQVVRVVAVDINRALRAERCAVDVDSVRSIEPAEQIEQCALSGATGTDDRDVFPAAYVRIHTAQMCVAESADPRMR